MQSAETVLGVLRERGRLGLPLEQLYRQMFNPQLYLLAYGRIYPNQGAMTPGVSQETVDGMSLGKIGRIIEALRHERYRFRPARRVLIPKKNGKMRPLGLPTWSDKLVGEVVRLLLEAYYEPTFSDRSHGFRPGRGCHTALREVAHTWTGTTWFIEGDVSDCFGSLDHEVMLSTLAERIHDNRFLRLVRGMLTAGYLEDWTWHETLSGAPQGGVASPVLSNIYLHKLDVFVETVLIPEYTRGTRRVRNPAYRKVEQALATARRCGDRAGSRALVKQLHSLPSQDPDDPNYRRLRYCRYADDTLLGFAGPKAEAEEIKQRLAAFLRDESSVSKMAAKHKAKIITPHGPRTCFEASIARDSRTPLVARFGGIPLKRQKTATLVDRQPHRPLYPHKQLIGRLLRGRCEICASTDTIEVHHVRKLADLAPAGVAQPVWAKIMASKRRKTLIVCDTCHGQIHAAQTTLTQ
jgi:group II intron reverse transcriptase/maturase